MNLFSPFCYTFLGSYTCQEHISMFTVFFLQLFHTSLGSYADQEQISMCLDNNKLLCHKSFESFKNKVDIAVQMDLLKQLFHLSFGSYINQEQETIIMDLFQPSLKLLLGREMIGNKLQWELLTAVLQMSWILCWSKTDFNTAALLLHSWFLCWSKTYNNDHGFLSTACINISWLKGLETSCNYLGSTVTPSLRIFCVLKLSKR